MFPAISKLPLPDIFPVANIFDAETLVATNKSTPEILKVAADAAESKNASA